MFAHVTHIAALALLIPLSSPLAQDTTATVTGTITDSAGVPVAGAQVFVNRVGPRSTSDARGRFRLVGLNPGERTIGVRRLGYHSATVTLALARGESRDIAVRLAVLPVALDTVVSEARAASENLRRNGFYARRQPGFGYFLAREDIERLRPVDLVDLLRRLPFLLVTERLGRVRATTQNGRCRPVVYLDRLPMPDVQDIPVDFVDGIEWYRHASQVPVEFGRPGGTCAALIIWTR